MINDDVNDDRKLIKRRWSVLLFNFAVLFISASNDLKKYTYTFYEVARTLRPKFVQTNEYFSDSKFWLIQCYEC